MFVSSDGYDALGERRLQPRIIYAPMQIPTINPIVMSPPVNSSKPVINPTSNPVTAGINIIAAAQTGWSDPIFRYTLMKGWVG